MFSPKRYYVELGSAFALYGILLVGTGFAQRAIEPAGTLKLALNLVPMIGAVAAAWAIMRGLWSMDELQRRVQLDAIAIAFLGTALITFGWGFAEGGGAPHLRAFAVWPIMGTLWLLGTIIATRRYR